MRASAVRATSSDDAGSYDVARGDACLGTTERVLPILGSVSEIRLQPFSLDGNVARRRHSIAAARAVLWDGVLPGFGLRVRRGQSMAAGSFAYVSERPTSSLHWVEASTSTPTRQGRWRGDGLQRWRWMGFRDG